VQAVIRRKVLHIIEIAGLLVPTRPAWESSAARLRRVLKPSARKLD